MVKFGARIADKKFNHQLPRSVIFFVSLTFTQPMSYSSIPPLKAKEAGFLIVLNDKNTTIIEDRLPAYGKNTKLWTTQVTYQEDHQG